MNQSVKQQLHTVKVSKLRALHDDIIVSDMIFDERITTSGIVLLSDNGKSSGIRPRWGKIYAVGPKQTQFHVGQWVCVAHGRWTRGVEIEDDSGTQIIRRIDNNEILLVSDEKPNDDTLSNAA